MKIVYYTRLFYPVGGGSVNIVDQLSKEWVKQGHDVVVVTTTLIDQEDDYPYTLIRTKKLREIYKAFKSTDALFFNETSIYGMPIALLSRKKYKVSHQANFSNHRNRINTFLRKRAKQIACSDFIAVQRPNEKLNVIGNPYDNNLLKAEPRSFSERQTDVVFVGRLAEDKGVDIFIGAIKLSQRNLKVKIIGDGPDREAIERDIKENKLDIEMLGWLEIDEIAKVLNDSKVQVIPSRFKEPFGIVALEGLAMGCRLVVMNHGGLPQSSGGFASFMQKLTAEECFKCTEMALDSGDYSTEEQLAIDKHLAEHEAKVVANKYLEL